MNGITNYPIFQKLFSVLLSIVTNYTTIVFILVVVYVSSSLLQMYDFSSMD